VVDMTNSKLIAIRRRVPGGIGNFPSIEWSTRVASTTRMRHCFDTAVIIRPTWGWGFLKSGRGCILKSEGKRVATKKRETWLGDAPLDRGRGLA